MKYDSRMHIYVFMYSADTDGRGPWSIKNVNIHLDYGIILTRYILSLMQYVRTWAGQLAKPPGGALMCWYTHTQGAKPQFFGKPDMACCKRLCDKNIIHGPSGVEWNCTTLKICYWIGVVGLINVPPSMTKRCYIKSRHIWQIYFIYLFLIKYKTTWYI